MNRRVTDDALQGVIQSGANLSISYNPNASLMQSVPVSYPVATPAAQQGTMLAQQQQQGLVGGRLMDAVTSDGRHVTVLVQQQAVPAAQPSPVQVQQVPVGVQGRLSVIPGIQQPQYMLQQQQLVSALAPVTQQQQYVLQQQQTQHVVQLPNGQYAVVQAPSAKMQQAVVQTQGHVQAIQQPYSMAQHSLQQLSTAQHGQYVGQGAHQVVTSTQAHLLPATADHGQRVVLNPAFSGVVQHARSDELHVPSYDQVSHVNSTNQQLSSTLPRLSKADTALQQRQRNMLVSIRDLWTHSQQTPDAASACMVGDSMRTKSEDFPLSPAASLPGSSALGTASIGNASMSGSAMGGTGVTVETGGSHEALLRSILEAQQKHAAAQHAQRLARASQQIQKNKSVQARRVQQQIASKSSELGGLASSLAASGGGNAPLLGAAGVGSESSAARQEGLSIFDAGSAHIAYTDSQQQQQRSRLSQSGSAVSDTGRERQDSKPSQHENSHTNQHLLDALTSLTATQKDAFGGTAAAPEFHDRPLLQSNANRPATDLQAATSSATPGVSIRSPFLAHKDTELPASDAPTWHTIPATADADGRQGADWQRNIWATSSGCSVAATKLDASVAKQTDHDLKSVLCTLGVELAHSGISLEAALTTGWLGDISKDDVRVLNAAYTSAVISGQLSSESTTRTASTQLSQQQQQQQSVGDSMKTNTSHEPFANFTSVTASDDWQLNNPSDASALQKVQLTGRRSAFDAFQVNLGLHEVAVSQQAPGTDRSASSGNNAMDALTLTTAVSRNTLNPTPSSVGCPSPSSSLISLYKTLRAVTPQLGDTSATSAEACDTAGGAQDLAGNTDALHSLLQQLALYGK